MVQLLKQMRRVVGVIVFIFSVTACATDNTPQPRPVPEIKSAENLKVSWDVGALSSSFPGSFAPVIDSDNAIFTADSKGHIFKIDSTDGTIINETRLKHKLSSGTAISSDSIFVTSLDDYLLCVDKATLKIKWEVKLPTISIEPPQVGGNTVIVRSIDATILAVSVDTGKLLWSYQRPIPPLTLRTTETMQMYPLSGVLIAGMPGGSIAVINLTTGTQIWENYIAIPTGSTDLDKLTDIAMRPVLDDRELCVGTYNGKIACVDAVSSNIIWSRAFSGSTQLLIDTQNVYAISQDGVIYAYDKNTGAVVWSNDVLQYRSLSSPAFLGNNLVTVDSDGYINLLNKNTGVLGARIDSSLIGGTSYPISNGYKVILQSANGNLASIVQ